MPATRWEDVLDLMNDEERAADAEARRLLTQEQECLRLAREELKRQRSLIRGQRNPSRAGNNGQRGRPSASHFAVSRADLAPTWR